MAWVGDYYADEPDDFDFPNCSAFYVPYYGEIWGDTVSAVGVASTDFTLDGKFLLNHDTRQFIDLGEYKANSIDKHGWTITAVGNDCGNSFLSKTPRPKTSAKPIFVLFRRVEGDCSCKKSPKNLSKLIP